MAFQEQEAIAIQNINILCLSFKAGGNSPPKGYNAMLTAQTGFSMSIVLQQPLLPTQETLVHMLCMPFTSARKNSTKPWVNPGPVVSLPIAA